jgi:hypothetical protein
MLRTGLGSVPSIHWLDLVLGLRYYRFALGDVIHSFLVKINWRSREFRAVWRQRRLVPAQLWRERR